MGDLGDDASVMLHGIVEDTVWTEFYIASYDQYLAGLKSIIRKGRPHPITEARTRLAAHKRENIKLMGLKRVTRPSPLPMCSTATMNRAPRQAAGLTAPARLRRCNEQRGGQSFDIKSLTTSSGQSDTCQNPFCKSVIEPLPDGYRRTARRYCSDRCKLDGYALTTGQGVAQQKLAIIEFHRLLDRA